MNKKLKTFSLLVSMVVVLSFMAVPAGTALAHWNPGDCVKMHYAQLPDLETGLDVRGNNPIAGEDHYVADDFWCSETGPITDIHVWGSWKDDLLPAPDGPPKFWIQIYSDNTDAVPSKPAGPDPVWSYGPFLPDTDPDHTCFYYTVREYATVTDEAFYDPSDYPPMMGTDTKVYQYNFYICPEEAFRQYTGNIYWLKVMETSKPANGATWGWKTSQDHYGEGAVWRVKFPGAPRTDWETLLDPAGGSLDMAFVITGQDINVEKSANVDQAVCGDTITYTYEVTSCGTDLTSITVDDDTCTSPAYVSGDDGDNILEVGETWTYTCNYPVTIDDAIAGSVNNTVFAEGTRTDPEGATVVVYDYDYESVDVVSGSSITICKDADPESGQLFGFGGDLGDFSLYDDGNPCPGCDCKTFDNPPPGDYTITETVPGGWHLGEINCTGAGTPCTVDLPNHQVTIHLGCNEDVCCTFVNAALGKITVQKTAIGPGAGITTFNFNGYTTFHIVDSGSNTLDNLIPSKWAGTYAVTELDEPGWALFAMGVSDNVNSNSGFDLPSKTATCYVDPGEEVTATFSNVELGKIRVTKVTDPHPDLTNQDFTFTGDVFGTIKDGGVLEVPNLMPIGFPGGRPYVSTETDPLPYHWALVGLTVDDGGSTHKSTVNLGARTVTFLLDPGEVVTATFLDTELGEMIVEKQTCPDGASTGFTFVGDVAGNIKDDGQIVVPDVMPIKYRTDKPANTPYYSTEIVPADWALNNIAMEDEKIPDSIGDADAKTAYFFVQPGETVKATFTDHNTSSSLPPPSPPPTGGPVGIIVMPMDKAGLLLPWLGLAGLLVVITGAAVFARRRINR